MIPEIFVIIPVYNAESYIEECLNSVMTQTFWNIEVVLIDDGSEDLSNEIMQSFCIKDKRFKLFSQPNAGVSAARNEGIKRSTGRYIFFLNSDDTLISTTFEELSIRTHKTDADIIMGNILFCTPDGKQTMPYEREEPFKDVLEIKGDICYLELMRMNSFPPLVGVYLIKRSFLFNNQFFF